MASHSGPTRLQGTLNCYHELVSQGKVTLENKFVEFQLAMAPGENLLSLMSVAEWSPDGDLGATDCLRIYSVQNIEFGVERNFEPEQLP